MVAAELPAATRACTDGSLGRAAAGRRALPPAEHVNAATGRARTRVVTNPGCRPGATEEINMGTSLFAAHSRKQNVVRMHAVLVGWNTSVWIAIHIHGYDY